MNRYVKRFTSLFCFLFLMAALFAQNYIVKETKKGAYFYQRLEWESTGVVTQFKLIIEQLKDGQYVKIEEYITKETWQEVSLDAGKYRFKVIFYNVFGQPAFETKYENFEILAAHQPSLKYKGSPSVYQSENPEKIVISANVEDIGKSAVFYLVNQNKKNAAEIKPEEVRFEEGKVYISFDKAKVEAGKYRLVVKNPGGLTSESKVIDVKEKKLLNFDLGLSLMPSIFTDGNYVSHYFDKNLFVASFMLDASGALILNPKSSIGIGADFSYTKLSDTQEIYTLKANLLRSDLTLFYEHKLYNSDKLDLSLAGFAGAGCFALQNVHATYIDSTKSDGFTSIVPEYTAGVTLKSLLKNGFYGKTGIKFDYAPEIPDSDYSAFACDFILGVGYRF